jgi:hypothetical protein
VRRTSPSRSEDTGELGFAALVAVVHSRHFPALSGNFSRGSSSSPAHGSQPGAQAGRHAQKGQENVGNRSRLLYEHDLSTSPISIRAHVLLLSILIVLFNPLRNRNHHPNRNLLAFYGLVMRPSRAAHLNPQKRHVVPIAQRRAAHKPLLIWHFLALNGTVSEGLGFRKSMQEKSYGIFKIGQVHSLLRHYRNRSLRQATRHVAHPERANNPYYLYYIPSSKIRKCTYAIFP